MRDRSTVQIPDDLKSELEAFRIRLAARIGKVPATHEVIRAVLTVGIANYEDSLRTLIEIRGGQS